MPARERLLPLRVHALQGAAVLEGFRWLRPPRAASCGQAQTAGLTGCGGRPRPCPNLDRAKVPVREKVGVREAVGRAGQGR